MAADIRTKKRKAETILPQSQSWLSAWCDMKANEKTKYWNIVEGLQNLCQLITHHRHPPNWKAERPTQWWRQGIDSILKASASFPNAKCIKMLPSLPNHFVFDEIYCDNLENVQQSLQLELIVRFGRTEFDQYVRSQYLEKYFARNVCRLMIYNEGQVGNEIKQLNTKIEKCESRELVIEVFTPQCLQIFRPGQLESDYEIVPKMKVAAMRIQRNIPESQVFFPVNASDRMVILTGARVTAD